MATRTVENTPENRTRAAGTRLAYVVLLGAAFTSSWTGVRLGPLQPVDWLLLIATISAAGAIVSGPVAVPRWLWGAAGVVGVVLLLQLIAPTAPGYIASRFELDSLAAVSAGGAPPASPVSTAAQWLVALAVLPFVVTNIVVKSGRSVEPLVVTWAAGAGVSALFALSDYAGLSSIGTQLVGYVNTSGRESGLASHANNLGFACAVAAPIAMRLLARRPVRGAMLGAALLVGVLLSGSRGAQAGLVLAMLLTLVFLRGGRRVLPPVLYFGLVAGLLLALLAPSFLAQFSNVLRFGSSSGTQASNEARQSVANQAVADFAHNPVFGVGYTYLTAAHSIYLQLLSAGGVLLAGALLVYWVGAIRSGRRLDREPGFDLAGYLVCCVLVWLAVGVVENQLADRYLYFPIAAITALTAVRAHGTSMRGDGERELSDASPSLIKSNDTLSETE